MKAETIVKLVMVGLLLVVIACGVLTGLAAKSIIQVYRTVEAMDH